MTSNESLGPEEFLRRFRLALGSLPVADRDDIVAEIRSHLFDREREGRADSLSLFGSPEEYAARFVAERALAGALAEGSSWSLRRALLTGLRDTLLVSTLVLPLGLVELGGLILAFLGLAKIFVPKLVGAFVDREGRFVGFGLQVWDEGAGFHEVLGWWGVPLMLIPGIALVWAANRALRGIARWRLRLVRRGAAEHK